MQTELTREGIADEMVTRLEISKDDRATMARLKRCAGRALNECPEAFGLFYRILPQSCHGRTWLEEPCFLVATLFPMAPDRFEGDLGQSIRTMSDRDPQSSDSLDRRISILLDCDRDSLRFRLRQVVRLLASREIGIDWRQLLVDIMEWDRPDRAAQKRWARSYFSER